jgi:hypothetical protein
MNIGMDIGMNNKTLAVKRPFLAGCFYFPDGRADLKTYP